MICRPGFTADGEQVESTASCSAMATATATTNSVSNSKTRQKRPEHKCASHMIDTLEVCKHWGLVKIAFGVSKKFSTDLMRLSVDYWEQVFVCGGFQQASATAIGRGHW